MPISDSDPGILGGSWVLRTPVIRSPKALKPYVPKTPKPQSGLVVLYLEVHGFLFL